MPPARTTALKARLNGQSHPSVWTSDGTRRRCGWPWSRRPPGSTPPATGSGCDDLVPRDTDLVVLPEAFARDFGEAGSDLSAFAEPLPGPFADAVAVAAAERGTTVVAGMFETVRRPGAAAQHPGRPRRGERRVPQDPPLRLVRLSRVRRADAPAPLEPGHRRPRRVPPRADDLLRPSVPRTGAGSGRPGRRGPRGPCRLGGGPRKVDHWRTLVCARAIENTVYVVAAGQPGPRYAGHSMVVGSSRRGAGRGRRRAGRCCERR